MEQSKIIDTLETYQGSRVMVGVGGCGGGYRWWGRLVATAYERKGKGEDGRPQAQVMLGDGLIHLVDDDAYDNTPC
jgi:hypothetical protein